MQGPFNDKFIQNGIRQYGSVSVDPKEKRSLQEFEIQDGHTRYCPERKWCQSARTYASRRR